MITKDDVSIFIGACIGIFLIFIISIFYPLPNDYKIKCEMNGGLYSRIHSGMFGGSSGDMCVWFNTRITDIREQEEFIKKLETI